MLSFSREKTKKPYRINNACVYLFILLKKTLHWNRGKFRSRYRAVTEGNLLSRDGHGCTRWEIQHIFRSVCLQIHYSTNSAVSLSECILKSTEPYIITMIKIASLHTEICQNECHNTNSLFSKIWKTIKWIIQPSCHFTLPILQA